MSKRSRIFFGLLLIYAIGMAAVLYRVVSDLDPRYRESAEESLVETSQLLATLIEQDVRDGAIDTARLDNLFKAAYAREFSAQIFSVNKTKVELRAYVTDRNGLVLFDSTGQSQGKDFSQWRDVQLTLKGEYGARTSLDIPGDPNSAVMYMAAPVRWSSNAQGEGSGEIIGAVSVGKPVQTFGQFVAAARSRTLYAGLISVLRSSSHTISSYTEQGGATVVGLNPTAEPTNNRDFILNYRLAGDKIETGVMLYKGQDENFFLAMVEPPKAPAATAITPREYIFVVDISGSMHGFPLDTAKGVLRELIGGLRPSDTFNVLLFSGSNSFLNPTSVPATKANIDQAIRTIDKEGGGGSTELIPALKRVYAQPKAADVSRTVVVVTDGYVTVEREAFELVRNNLSSANVFSFGIGSSVNRHLMEGLARAGMGEPFIITKPAEAAEQAARFRKMIDSPVLTNVKVRFEGLDVYDVEPRQLPDLLAQRPLIVFGKWRGDAKGTLIVDGNSASGPLHFSMPINASNATDTAALRHLWARHRIAALSDQEALEGGSAAKDAITDLGLKYNLLTQYTSFLAVDQVVRNKAPADTPSVNQPSPLPQGVENSALGAEVPSTPEPATWGAMLMTLSVLAMLAYRRRRAHHYTS